MVSVSTAWRAGGCEGPRRLCLLSADLAPLLPLDQLGSGLRLRRVGLTTDAREASVVIVSETGGADDSRLTGQAVSHGLPVLSLGRGMLPGTFRLSEAPAETGGDRQLQRWLAGLAARLTEDAVASAADFASSAMPPSSSIEWVGSGDAASAEPWLRDLAAPHGSTGPRALADLGRDRCRRAVAAEAIFNAFPPDRTSAAIAEAVLAVGRGWVPTVSVVISSHNYREFVGEAIRSVLVQTVPAHEVIVVDDGSTDGSAQVIEGIAGIIPVLKPNGGQASALNAGFARARGDVVIFLDADDRLRPEAVSRVSGIDPRDYARLQYGLETIDGAGRSTGLYPGSGRVASGHLLGAVSCRGIVPFMPTSGNAFPRWVLERLLPMPEDRWRICADLYLVLMTAALGPVVSIEDMLGQYRVHGRNAYFRPLLAEPFLNSARLHRRLGAWRQLVRRLPDLVPGCEDDGTRLNMQDLVLRTAILGGHSGVREILRDARDALLVAAAARNLPLARRLRHALSPAALAWRRVRHGAPPEGMGSPTFSGPLLGSPEEVAGPSAWPRLESGDEMDLTAAGRGPDPLGRGWTRKDRQGAVLTDSIGSLAVLLPEFDVDWRLRLDFAVKGDEPVRGVELRCNGSQVGRRELLGHGELDLRLPRDLLRPSPKGGCGCCLTIRTETADAGRVRLLRLRADILYGHGPRAPLLPEGVMEQVGPGRPAAAALLSGWAWDDGEEGAVLESRRARLDLSLIPGHRNTVTLGFAQGVRSVAVALNGVLAAPYVAADGRFLTLELPPQDIPASGRASLELLAFAEAGNGAWPTVRLTGVRRDVVPYEFMPLVWNRLYTGAEIVAATLFGSPVLVSEGADARLVTSRLRLPLALPAVTDAALLEVTFALLGPLGAPSGGCLTVAGRSFGVCLARESTVRIGLSAGTPGSILLEGAFDVDPGSVALRSLLLTLRNGRCHPPGPLPEAGVKGRTLMALVAEEGAWHPTDEALWLAEADAELVLPPQPATVALDVTVLTVSDPPQRIALQAGGHGVRSAEPGRQTLRLPLSPSIAAQGGRLRMGTDRLIAAGALGLDGPGMLGGAVAAVVPVIGVSAPPASVSRIGESAP